MDGSGAADRLLARGHSCALVVEHLPLPLMGLYSDRAGVFAMDITVKRNSINMLASV